MEAGKEIEKPGSEVKVKDEKNGEKVEENDSKIPEETKEIKKEAEEPVKEEPIDDEILDKIKDQVEFYFGDVNMQNDKFLNEQVKLDEGWIPMNVLMTFKMLNSLCSKPEIVLKAVERGELMEISEDRQKVRRRLDKPLPVYNEEYKKAQVARTVYVKGFPQQNMTINILKNFFKDFGTIENIIMRKYKDVQDKQKTLKFKGSVFVLFKTIDEAKAFVEKPDVKYNDTELIKMLSETHAEQKAAEKEETKKTKKNKASNKNQEEKNEKSKEIKGLAKGALLRVTAGKEDIVTWELIKNKVRNIMNQKPAFVEYDTEKNEGYVRFFEENTAKRFLELFKPDDNEIGDAKMSFELVEGEEEEKYLAKALENLKNDKKHKSHHKGYKRGKKRSASPSVNNDSPKKRK